MTSNYNVIVAGAGRLHEVGPLFKGMVAEQAWQRRRRQYSAWLAGGRSWLLLADAAAGGQPAAGYAMVRLTEPGPTWDLGATMGELESLAVAEQARGQGVGTMLMDASRDLLRARGASFWSVGVVEANTDAVRLYERAGFQPFYRQLLGPL